MGASSTPPPPASARRYDSPPGSPGATGIGNGASASSAAAAEVRLQEHIDCRFFDLTLNFSASLPACFCYVQTSAPAVEEVEYEMNPLVYEVFIRDLKLAKMQQDLEKALGDYQVKVKSLVYFLVFFLPLLCLWF